jgi:PAS domain S-box-containing protein
MLNLGTARVPGAASREGADMPGSVIDLADDLFDVLPVAVHVLDGDGRVVRFNRSAQALWGGPPPAAEAAGLGSLAAAVHEREITIERPDGTRLVALISTNPVRSHDGRLTGAVVCAQDITERVRTEAALREREQHLIATFESAAIGIAETDAGGRFLRVNEAFCAITGHARDELLKRGLGDVIHPEDVAADLEVYKRQVSGVIERFAQERRCVRADGETIWISIAASAVRGPDGRFAYAVHVVRDVSERRAVEARQKLLLDELNHRVKNTLATVQSLAAQTIRGTGAQAAYRETFEARLIALSKAHDLLTRRGWENADLIEVLASELAPYREDDPSRIKLAGPPVLLAPRAALTLGMIVHELATNAVKYGALSVAGGNVAIGWTVEPRGAAAPMLQLEWLERGGPPVRSPRRRGFGSRLILRGVATDLDGQAWLDFEPLGLRARMEFPIKPPKGRDVRAAEIQRSA